MIPDAPDPWKLLREAFLQSLPSRLADLRGAWNAPEAERVEALRFQAHRLAGAAGTFGHMDISEAAKSLEDALRDGGDSASVETALAHIERLAAQPRSPLPPPTISSAMPAPARRFALISGEPGAALAVQRTLAELGHELPSSPGSGAALAGMDHPLPEVIVVAGELQLLSPSWGEAFASLPSPPILLFASGTDDSESRLLAVRAGGEGFFRIPEDAQALADRLDALRMQGSEEPFRVVLVEDDALVRQEHAFALEAAGMRVLPALDATSTLTACLSESPDLVLLDWYLDTCTGPEIAAMLRQVNGLVGVPIVFLSSERDLGRQMSALHRGGDNFLTKPISPIHLVAAVTAQARRGRVLRGLMTRDGLTGLLNHSALEQRLEEEVGLARRRKAPLSFVMMDLDHFKRVNDTHGHPMGDRVLKGLCRVLSRRLRRSDIVGRYGGEEFAVVFPDTRPEEAIRVMEGVLADFRTLVFGSGPSRFSCTFSAGVAGFPDQGDPGSLRSVADQALYRAKAQGRSRVVLGDGLE